MCRLLAVVSSELTDFRFSLAEAPRSLSRLSREHPHGWGLAVRARDRDWTVYKEAACADDDRRYHSLAAEARGDLLLAHVRQGTVGPQAVANTHPFRQGRWVFAHNGTVRNLAWLAAQASAERLAQVEGDTDSERLFACLLTRLDAVGASEHAAANRDAADRAVAQAVAACAAEADLGAVTFLLSDGDTTYVHRSGRSLYLLERGWGDAIRSVRVSAETHAVITTPWSDRRRAVLVASERLSDEPWREIADGSLLRLDTAPWPTWTPLTGGLAP